MKDKYSEVDEHDIQFAEGESWCVHCHRTALELGVIKDYYCCDCRKKLNMPPIKKEGQKDERS